MKAKRVQKDLKEISVHLDYEELLVYLEHKANLVTQDSPDLREERVSLVQMAGTVLQVHQALRDLKDDVDHQVKMALQEELALLVLLDPLVMLVRLVHLVHLVDLLHKTLL